MESPAEPNTWFVRAYIGLLGSHWATWHLGSGPDSAKWVLIPGFQKDGQSDSLYSLKKIFESILPYF